MSHKVGVSFVYHNWDFQFQKIRKEIIALEPPLCQGHADRRQPQTYLAFPDLAMMEAQHLSLLWEEGKRGGKSKTTWEKIGPLLQALRKKCDAYSSCALFQPEPNCTGL